MNRILHSFIVASLTFGSLAFAADVPWPEHPRPDFQRPAWVNLNGQWSFDFDPKAEGEAADWYKADHKFGRQITVPFPWESKLSGIADTEYKGVAWYSREVTLPDGPEWKDRHAWLVIGACDWEAQIWVNGRPAGKHVGGYAPFEVDLSELAKPGEKVIVTIRVVDTTDPEQPVGKQLGWYTRTSGLWQTVYLEARGQRFIQSIRTIPSIADGTVSFSVTCHNASGGGKLAVRSPDDAFPPVELGISGTGADASSRPIEAKIKLKDPKLWTPDSPTLYRVAFDVQDAAANPQDHVESYFGLREVTAEKAPGREYKYICLNGKPIYLLGALHQSFHPDGIYQYPDDATMRSDYELCKLIGLNFLRIHIKAPVPRELYWADKIGVMIQQDMPNFDRHTEQARKWYEEMLRDVVARDFNHPAIISWLNFNETWGLNNPGGYSADRQEWVEKIYALTKQLDPTRLVEDQSPCNHDHVISDINSWHFYTNDFGKAKEQLQAIVDKTYPGSTFNYIGGRKQSDAPTINSEYGGIDCSMGDQDISWCFKFLTNEMRKHDKICGYMYTELSDIEWEHNGFVNYDRSPKEYGYDYWHPGFSLKDLNNPDFIVIDAPPMIEIKPGREMKVPIKISHWSDYQAKGLTLRWCLNWPGNPLRQPTTTAPVALEWQSRPATWQPYTVLDQEPITITSNETSRVGALLVELLDDKKVLARNYVNVCETTRVPGIRVGSEMELTFSPGDFARRTFTDARPMLDGKEATWAAGNGTGYYEYDLEIPEGVDPEKVNMLIVSAELASRSDGDKVDWPARRRHTDRPQTDTTKWATEVQISINGVKVKRINLLDDPADARGALSHHQGLQGAYGKLAIATAMDAGPADTLDLRKIVTAASSSRRLTVRFEVPEDATRKGGLSIYGEGTGRYGMSPKVLLSFQPGYKLDKKWARDHSPAVNRARDNVRAIIPTAQDGGHEWLYTTDKPAANWAAPDFDASAWKKGRSSFGSKGSPNTTVGTAWDAPDIWLRTEFTIDDPAAVLEAAWRIYHNEDAEVYLNGQKVVGLPGSFMNYIDLTLKPDALKALVKGRNVVAVHCRWTSDDHTIDVGLTTTGSSKRGRS